MVSGYHDEELTGSYSSASAIRKLLAYASSSIHLEEEGMFDEPAMSEVLTRLKARCLRPVSVFWKRCTGPDIQSTPMTFHFF
mgnify:FL=1